MLGLSVIKWPLPPQEAVNLYLRSLLEVLDEFEISFEEFEFDQEYDPVILTREYLSCPIQTDLEQKRIAAADLWWSYVCKEGITNFTDPHLLKARMALSLLLVKVEDFDALNEHLSWFIEFIKRFGKDINKVILIMENFYKPYM